jgi:hypothetical protein
VIQSRHSLWHGWMCGYGYNESGAKMN